MLARRQLTALAVLSFFICSAASADIRLPRVLSDRMVLQRERPLPVWGWADPGEVVKVTLGESSATTTGDKHGRFRIDLPAMKAGGPHKLVVEGRNTVTVQDILIGEVWVCFGQSNMQWRVNQTPTGGADLGKSNDPLYRLCNVNLLVTTIPQSDGAMGWAASAPGSAAQFSAVAYYFGKHLREKLDVPVGIIHASAGAIPIESFTPREGSLMVPSQAKYVRLVEQVHEDYRVAREEALLPWIEQARQAIRDEKPLPPPPHVPDNIVQRGWMPQGLFNGAINPLIPFAIRGAVMYQGEANNGTGMEYLEKKKALIGGWRKLWGQGDFPFLFVQLAPWSGYPEGNLEGVWEAQRLTLTAIPNTGIAVTTDLVPNIADIHPPRKKEVGERLALWALAKTYGQDKLVYSGPLFKSAAIEGDKVRLKFDHIGGGLASRDGKPLDHFQVGTTDGFVDAQATIDGDSIVVSSEKIARPEFVRFGWKNNAQPNLVNKEGLPASPFRTDHGDVRLSTGTRFAIAKSVEISSNHMPGVIRYTLDGSIPTVSSPVYNAPLKLEKTTTVTARLFSDDGRGSLPAKQTYAKVDAVAHGGKTLGPGLDHEFFIGRWAQTPGDFASLKPGRTMIADTARPVAFSETFMALHRLRGYVMIPASGRYAIHLTERDRRIAGPMFTASLLIGDQPVPLTAPPVAADKPAILAKGKSVRVRLEGSERMLSMAEVQVIEAGTNAQLQNAGKAAQSSTGYGCLPQRAADGNLNAGFTGNSISHTDTQKDPWWSVDLGAEKSIGQIKVFNRGDCCGERLNGAIVEVLDADEKVVWKSRIGTVETGSVDEFIAGDTVPLTAGVHPFELTYREVGGFTGLKVIIEGPGIERQELPATMLLREEK